MALPIVRPALGLFKNPYASAATGQSRQRQRNRPDETFLKSPRKETLFTHHPHIMNKQIQAAFAVILALGLSSCAVSYPYCDAYNAADVAVEYEVQPSHDSDSSEDLPE